jgi:23S rRNA (guanosine2251-2'-O)-methyltransferase
MDRNNRRKPRKPPRRGAQTGGSGYWMWGRHTVLAALRNPNRRILRIMAAEATADEARQALAGRPGGPTPSVERLDPQVDLPPDAVHQGLAALVAPLPDPDPAMLEAPGPALVVALDQVNDPRNVGAILRTAAVFGASAIVAPRDNMPGESGVMAKAASGALEVVPVIRVTNLSRTLDSLKRADYFAVGLDAAGSSTIEAHLPLPRAVLVAGAEGRGLRRLVREHCDVLVALPVGPAAKRAGIDSLNVGAAVAVALHELVRPR